MKKTSLIAVLFAATPFLCAATPLQPQSDDPVIMTTLKLFRENKAFPKKTDDKKDRKVAMNYDYRGTHAKTTLVAHA